MDIKDIFKPYTSFTAGQLQLLCFFAYTGKDPFGHNAKLYSSKEKVAEFGIRQTLLNMRNFFLEYNFYGKEVNIKPIHRAPLLIYLLVENKTLLEHFNNNYRGLQDRRIGTLIDQLQACLHGDTPDTAKCHDASVAESFIPLTCLPQFAPIVKTVDSSILQSFITKAILWQIDRDIPDDQQLMNELFNENLKDLPRKSKETIRSAIALHDFYAHGNFDAEAAIHDNIYAKMLSAVRTLYAGDYEKAASGFISVLRDTNKGITFQTKRGYFNNVLHNFMLVVAYHFKNDDGKKLRALSKKDAFAYRGSQQSARLFLSYFLSNRIPSDNDIKYNITDTSNYDKPLYLYMALLPACFFGIGHNRPPQLPPLPQFAILRHELSPWLQLDKEEKSRLEEAFGGTPISTRFRFKAEWELLLEELTPKSEEEKKQEAEKETRVAYIINNGYVDLREQKRLKSGEWGAGKRMTLDTFRRGTPFMDETDRTIAQNLTGYYSYDIDLKVVLPRLIGSDKVYTGYYAPLVPVTIAEEKPYLIIQKGPNGFQVKSNLANATLNNRVTYRKDSDTHYTVINMSDRQYFYYSKLLNFGVFPLSAEPMLREFLPKVSDIIEVHSDLVEGGSTLDSRDGSPKLCLQIMPKSGYRNMFSAYCHAKPLTDGNTLMPPAAGLNPCVAEQDGMRYQVKRDIKGERTNLEMLASFLEDYDIAENGKAIFSKQQAIDLSPEGLLKLLEFAHEHDDALFVEWPKGGNINLKISNPANWNISLRSNSGWFELEGEIPIDDDTVISASQLLQLVSESTMADFIRLNDSTFLAITGQLRKQLSRIESLAVNNRGHLQISPFHASLLGSTLNGELTIAHDRDIDDMQKKIKKSMDQRPRVPSLLKAELRPYQADGYQWMVRMTGWGAGVCLADDMGLGKTVQAIAFMLHTAKKGPALIAAPASVVPNWRSELKRFAPSLNVTVLNVAADRKETIEKAAKGDVVLTTYGLFVTNSEDLQEKKWNTVCLDEAHVIKNRGTKTSALVMKLQAEHRIILTGTPVQNHLGELWNLFQFINPGLLGSYDQFANKFITPIEQLDDKERSRQLKRIISPFMLRRTKQEVVEELPDKTEINMPVELSEDELAIYESIRRKAKKMLEEESGNAPSINTLAEITRLRQAACSAALVQKAWKGESTKVNILCDMVHDIVEGGNSVLVFSQFTSFLAMVCKSLKDNGIDFIYLDGGTPMKKREQLVRDFQRGLHPVFIISLKAGGLGLNLTEANYVIHLDPWWNPAIEQQATDRTYRIGQQQNVTVYHLISQHTIEEKILRLHRTKRNLANAMLQGTNSSHKLTSRELLEMIGE